MGRYLTTSAALDACPTRSRECPAGAPSALREALGIGEEGWSYRVSLFPAVHEVYAAMILLVHAKGLNLSVMARLKVSDIERLPGFKPGRWIYQVDTRQAPPRARQALPDHVRGARGAAVAADAGHRTAGPRHSCRSRLRRRPSACFLPEERLRTTRERPVHHGLDDCGRGCSRLG